MCDNPVAPATAEPAAVIDSKGKTALAKKFSFLANKLQAATTTERCPWSLTRKLFKANCDLTETNLDTEIAIEFWSERMAIYKLIVPLALDLLLAPASQAFVERIFFLCDLMAAGRRNQIETSLQMRAFLKLNKRLFE